MKTLKTALALTLALGTASCAGMQFPQPTEREQAAGIGGLVGGAGGALIGSFAGSALAGGLFGIPIGAVAGYYIGDQMARSDRTEQSRLEENQQELERLRRENERLRREQKER